LYESAEEKPGRVITPEFAAVAADWVVRAVFVLIGKLSEKLRIVCVTAEKLNESAGKRGFAS
jgi:hypothetical protein